MNASLFKTKVIKRSSTLQSIPIAISIKSEDECSTKFLKLPFVYLHIIEHHSQLRLFYIVHILRQVTSLLGGLWKCLGRASATAALPLILEIADLCGSSV